MKNIKTIGIVGHTGMVGSTLLRYFKKQKQFKVHGYSRRQPRYKKMVNNADVVFVCTPTPYLWPKKRKSRKPNKVGFDISATEQAVSKIKPGAIVVIKSTIPIGTIDRLQKKYPRLKMLFNPEFLSETTCDTDFTHPDRQFIGYTPQSFSIATQVLHLLPESPYDLICPAKEAELLKYINNLHGVLEVMESNHYYDVCQKENLDYERVIKAAVASKWIGCPMGRHYRVIYHKGFRGVGGACFPKDINAWLDWCEEQDIDDRILRAARDVNRDLLASQGLNEPLAEKIATEAEFKKLRRKKRKKAKKTS